MPREHLMRALDVYETMRHFSNVLRMTPFTFEEFCAALMSPDHSVCSESFPITISELNVFAQV